MTTQDRAAEVEAKQKKQREKGFDEYMSSPSTRVILSLMPRNEDHPDVLEMLLREAYNSGFNHGSGTILAEMLANMLRSPDGRR